MTEGRFWILSLWLALVFLAGGSSRADIPALMVLRPVSVLMLAYGLCGLTPAHFRQNRLLFALAAATIALPLVQLVPLPPEIWHALPGRGIVADIDREAALGGIWRPLSMAPSATWNAFWALIPPLATLALGLQLDEGQRARLVPVILAIGFASVFLGLLQTLGPADGPLYFYRFSHAGLPIGLFANRNHQGAFLAILIPMLLVWSAGRAHGQASARYAASWPAIAGGTIIVPLVLITGSRSASILALVAFASLPLLVIGRRLASHATSVRHPLLSRPALLAWLLLLGAGGLVMATIEFDRALAIVRLTQTNAMEDMRVLVMPTVVAMARSYAPWGTGLGSFEAVYLLYEPDALLRTFYMNHAHNDWLELVLTGGLPALLLLLAALAAYSARAVRLLASPDGNFPPVLLGRLGLVILLILGLASITDYPLRVPSLACLAAVAVLWGWAGKTAPGRDGPQDGTIEQTKTPT